MTRRIRKFVGMLVDFFGKESQQKELLSTDSEYLKTIYLAILAAKKNDFDSNDFKRIQECEKFRSTLLNNDELVSYEVFGLDKTSKVKEISQRASSTNTWSRLIYALIKSTSSSRVFEIGTNLGVSGAYILNALQGDPQRKFFTLEGLGKLCEIAENQFLKIDSPEHFKIYEGLFDQTFDHALKDLGHLDCAFIDGNQCLQIII